MKQEKYVCRNSHANLNAINEPISSSSPLSSSITTHVATIPDRRTSNGRRRAQGMSFDFLGIQKLTS